MPNHMKFCGCKACRRGRKGASEWIRAVVRKFRRKAKQDLKQGKTPDDRISVPYTD